MPTSVEEDTQASMGRLDQRRHPRHPEPRSVNSGRRGQQVHLCRPRSERTPKPQWADLNRRRHPSIQSPEVSTSVEEGSKSTCGNLGWKGHLSLDGPTSIKEGIQASRASKCRLRSERKTSPLLPTLIREDLQASVDRPQSEKATNLERCPSHLLR